MLERTRKYGRIVIYGLLLVSSVILLLGVGGIGGSTGDDATTLQYGLELEGGTRITAPLYGYTAEDVSLPAESNQAEIRQSIASQIDGVEERSVSIIESRRQSGEIETKIELTSRNVSQEQFGTVLEENSISYSSIRPGVTDQTRQEAIRVIDSKLRQLGLGAGSVREVRTTGGQNLILVEVPGRGQEEVESLLEDRGEVRIDIYYRNQSSYETRERVLTRDSFATIGTPQPAGENNRRPYVPVTLTSSSAGGFSQDVVETGIAPGGSVCTYEEAPNSTGPCLLTKIDNEVIYSAGMDPGLASRISSGQWEREPSFILQTGSLEEAQRLSVNLRAGALPSPLNFRDGSSVFVSPEQGEQFKQGSILIALAAILAVGLKVALQYREVRIAAPMVGVALSEVLILLGFASLVNYPIDLAAVGGLIAVVGTGIDDLIIVANEIFVKKELSSKRVYRNRYKKAFWVIGAAAVTTIVALSPLFVLSLGQLRGFAIFTVVGIVIGVFITRPVFGYILNELLVEN